MQLPIQNKIDDGVFSAIGLVMATSSAVHYSLALQLLRILSHNGIRSASVDAVVITFGMKADTILGLLKSLVGLHFPHIADKFDKAADALRASFTNKRDVIAHQAFANIEGKPDRIKTFRVKTVGNFIISDYGLTEKEIRKWAREFLDQSRKVDELLTSVCLSPWKDFRIGDLPNSEP